MIFVFDLDDTVCETDKYSEEYLLKFFKENNYPYKLTNTNVRYADAKFDWNEEQALDWYKTYGDKMMEEFPCKDNAVEVINELYDLGHTIVIATARGTDWHTNPEEVTKNWLAKNKIKYHKIYFGRTDKEEICKLENADFFIDDDIDITSKVANYMTSHPKQAFLMSSPYNRTISINKNITRINNFEDFKLKLKNLSIDL